MFKLHPAKKKKKKRHHKTPALASHNSTNAISSDFVCLHDSTGLFVVFFVVDLVNRVPFLFCGTFIYFQCNAAPLVLMYPDL